MLVLFYFYVRQKRISLYTQKAFWSVFWTTFICVVFDVLVVVVIYTFVRIWIPESVRLLPLYVFLFAAGVEILQYFNIVELLGVQDNVFLRTIIGTSFDVKDILCYAVGCVLIWLSSIKKTHG